MDHEEYGTIIWLPCKPGDNLFAIHDNVPKKFTVKKLHIIKTGILISIEDASGHTYDIIQEEIGINYYISMEKALEALAEQRKRGK